MRFWVFAYLRVSRDKLAIFLAFYFGENERRMLLFIITVICSRAKMFDGRKNARAKKIGEILFYSIYIL